MAASSRDTNCSLISMPLIEIVRTSPSTVTDSMTGVASGAAVTVSAAAFAAASAAFFAAAFFAAAAFAAVVLAAVVFAAADRAVDLDAAALVAAVLAAAVFAAAVFAAVVFAAVVAFAAVVFFAAAERAAVALRGELVVDDGSLVWPGIAFTSGSTTTSAVGAAFSAAAFVATVFAADAFAAAGFLAAGFLTAEAAVVRGVAGRFAAGLFAAGFFTAGADEVSSAAAAAVGVCFLAGARFADVFSCAISVWSTWAVRSSGEAVTVLRYQRAAVRQGRRAINCPRIAQIRRDLEAIGTLCIRCVVDHEMTTGASSPRGSQAESIP